MGRHFIQASCWLQAQWESACCNFFFLWNCHSCCQFLFRICVTEGYSEIRAAHLTFRQSVHVISLVTACWFSPLSIAAIYSKVVCKDHYRAKCFKRKKPSIGVHRGTANENRHVKKKQSGNLEGDRLLTIIWMEVLFSVDVQNIWQRKQTRVTFGNNWANKPTRVVASQGMALLSKTTPPS